MSESVQTLVRVKANDNIIVKLFKGAASIIAWLLVILLLVLPVNLLAFLLGKKFKATTEAQRRRFWGMD